MAGNRLIIPVAVIVSSILLFVGPGEPASRSFRELWNLGHIAYFVLVIYQLIKWKILDKFTLPVQWILYLSLTIAAGSVIELIQYGTERTPDVSDISRDVMGCLLVLAFSPGLIALSSKAWNFYIRYSIIVLLFIHMIPVTQALVDEFNACIYFPVLSNFETPFERDRWQGSAQMEIVRQFPFMPTHQLKIEFNTELYSSASLHYLRGNWSEYQHLNLKIFQPLIQPLRITIRVHDAEHENGPVPFQYNDRFNRSYVLKQGWNDISISLSDIRSSAKTRRIDMRKIRNINLFTTRIRESRSIYLEEIYLTD